MISVILFACYLPIVIIPALMPFRALRRIQPYFPVLAILPISAAAVALVLADLLTDLLGYAVAFVPLAISFLSLTFTIVGVRFALEARREGNPTLSLSVFAAIAAIPFGIALPYILSAAISLVNNLVGA